MNTALKKVEAWPFTFGGEEHNGWLPSEAVMPKPAPTERVLLDVMIEQIEGGYLLVWAARPSATCHDKLASKTGDTWHETIEDAESAAREYFGIDHGHWTDTSTSVL